MSGGSAWSAGMTIRAAQAQARQLLGQEGIAEAGLEAALILGRVLHLDRAGLLAHAPDKLGRLEVAELSALVERRLRREPLAYLTGVKHWFDLEMAVDRNVLIPRPETEVLATLAITEGRRLVETGVDEPWVVDVGTGSGALAIAVARDCPQARVLALDASAGALRTAETNVRRLAPERVEVQRADLLPDGHRMHIIMANLPYIPSGELAGLAPELAYEPRMALDGGPDGLALIEPLVARAAGALAPGGALLLECHHDQGRRIAELASVLIGGAVISVHADLAGIERFVRVIAPK